MQPRFAMNSSAGRVLDHQVVDTSCFRVRRDRTGQRSHPVGRVRRARPSRRRTSPSIPLGIRFIVSGRSLEVGEQQVGDVEVVGEQVALRVALLGPEDLREVRQPQLPLGERHPPDLGGLPADREPWGNATVTASEAVRLFRFGMASMVETAGNPRAWRRTMDERSLEMDAWLATLAATSGWIRFASTR